MSVSKCVWEVKGQGNDVSEPLSIFTVEVITDKPGWRNLVVWGGSVS